MKLPIPNKEAYLNAKPFPHAVIDGIFEDKELQIMMRVWPWKHQNYGYSKEENLKGSTMSEEVMGNAMANFIKARFASQKFVSFLEALTGITGLVFDPKKFALHETFPGGLLAPHLDYTINPKTGLQLRINVILYLNENWKPEYGGDLELYDSQPGYGGILTKSIISIEPVFNRMVIFTMDAETPAWHGHPKPLACPEGMSRKSIALNYFTIPQKKAVEQGTLFKRSLLKDLLPPIIYRKLKK